MFFLVLQPSRLVKEIASRFTFIAFSYYASDNVCVMKFLPLGAVGWSVNFDCGISGV